MLRTCNISLRHPDGDTILTTTVRLEPAFWDAFRRLADTLYGGNTRAAATAARAAFPDGSVTSAIRTWTLVNVDPATAVKSASSGLTRRLADGTILAPMVSRPAAVVLDSIAQVLDQSSVGLPF